MQRERHISVINNPNVLGTGCNYSNIGVTLAPGTLSMSGLPSFHQGLFDYHANDFTYSQVNCSTFNFLPSPNGSYDSLSWNFGNTLSGTNNYSNLFNPQHSFSDTGNYIVSLIIFYNKCYFDTIQHIITTTSVISLNLGNDTSICSGNQISFDAGTGYSSYLWNTGNTSSSINATNSGMYSVTVTNSSGCTGIDSINLYIQNPSVNLGNDFVLCYGQPLTLDAGSGFSSYLWQDGSTNQAYSVGASGTYWVAAINASGCIGSDTINVTFVTHPIVSFGPDTCVETGIILDAGSGTNYIYTWSTGATTQTINVVNSGNYYVEVQSGSVSSCFDKDTIYVKVIPTPVVNIGDTTICIQRSVQLFATQSNESPEFTYLWNPGGDTTSSITYSPNGNIGPNIITVLKTGCSSVIDTIIVTGKLCEITIPNVITPNNDGYNDYFVIKGLEDYPNTLLQIFNRWGKKVYESSNYQNNWNGENNNDGVYFYVITFMDYLNPMTGTITVINKLN